MQKRTVKKLMLSKETIANLEQLRGIQAGATYTCGYSCGPLQCPPDRNP